MSLMLDKLINSKAADALAKSKILTVPDFLKCDVDKLAEVSQLPAKIVLNLKDQFIKHHLPKPIVGDEYYSKQLKDCSILQTCIPGFDDILGGGLRMGTLVEICGSSGAGKTLLSLNVAVKLAGNYKICVLYVDTKGDLIPSHVASLIDELGFKEDSTHILENIKVSRVSDFHSFLSLLHHMQEISKKMKRVKVLVVDSIASLYFPFVGEKGEGNEGLSLLNHAASILKKLSSTLNLSVILVNLALNWSKDNVEVDAEDEVMRRDDSVSDEQIKAALGKFWEHVPNTRLFMSNHNSDKSCRVLSVDKSDYLASGNRTEVKINNNGTIS